MSLHSLPEELRLQIMTFLPDLPALQSLAVTAKAFNETVKENDLRLYRSVLSNCIPRPLLKETIMTWEARQYLTGKPRGSRWSKEASKQFVDRYFDPENDGGLQDISPSQAVNIAKTWDAILYFTHDCTQRAKVELLGLTVELPHPLRGHPLSKSELIRTALALSRMEIYSCVFGLSDWSNFEDDEHNELRRSLFWNHFSPWEIEQVACVYEYLRSRLLEAFIHTAVDHPADPGWVDDLSNMLREHNDCPITPWFVAHGLVLARNFLKAGIESRRSRSLITEESFYISSNILLSGLDAAIDPNSRNTLAEMSEWEQEHFIKSGCPPDSDAGPELIWRWSHQDSSPGYTADGWVIGTSQFGFRECRYVLWDQARLDNWGVMKAGWIDEYESHESREVYEEEWRERLDALNRCLQY